MTLEQMLNEWKKDSIVDRTDLGEEALKIISLHAKYMEIYKHEKLKYVQMQQSYYKLKKNKHEFYSMGPSKETEELGWTMPARGVILKADVQMYMDADDDIITATLRLALQEEKVELLKDIIKELNQRRWSIRAALDFLKWTSGG
jgi:hypothetical protein